MFTYVFKTLCKVQFSVYSLLCDFFPRAAMDGLGSTFNVKTFPKLSERLTSSHCFKGLHRHLVSRVWFECSCGALVLGWDECTCVQWQLHKLDIKMPVLICCGCPGALSEISRILNGMMFCLQYSLAWRIKHFKSQASNTVNVIQAFLLWR